LILDSTTFVDTNETTRVNNLVGSCSGTDKVNGINEDGSFNCSADVSVEGSMNETYIEADWSFGGEVSGTYDSIVIDNDALDDQYGFTNGTGINLTGTIFSLDLYYFNLWNLAYGWGDHALAGYLTASPFGDSIDDTELTGEDYGEFTCTGDEDGCTLNTGSFDDEYIELGDTFSGEVSGTYGAIVLDNDALDDQYVEQDDDSIITGSLNMTSIKTKKTIYGDCHINSSGTIKFKWC
jgi:hypothetical protein